MKRISLIVVVLATFGVLFQSCQSDPNSPGLEYMPDMYRSPAIEAYVDYGMDPYHFGDSLALAQNGTISARQPVAGTIEYGARFMPYHLSSTPADYERSATEVKSPIAMHKDHIEAGKAKYEIMCIHCHGAKGDGQGKLVQNEAILGVPNFAVALKDLEEGKMFHTITHGKGIMGSHAAQVNTLERWQIIQYIHILQNGGTMPKYNEDGYPIGYEKHWSAAAGYVGEGAVMDAVGSGSIPDGDAGKYADGNYNFGAMFGQYMDKLDIIDGATMGKPGFVQINGEWYTIEETEEPGFWDKFKGFFKKLIDKVTGKDKGE